MSAYTPAVLRPVLIAMTLCACTVAPSALPVPNLRLADDPIVVEAPLGEARAVTVRLMNSGTSDAQVQVTTDAPVSAPASFSIDAGSSRDVRLTVRPQTLDDVTVPLVFRTAFQTLTTEVRVSVDIDVDRDGVPSIAAGGTDCDDSRASVFPGATERCNGRDDDCDGRIDADAVDAQEWFEDEDQDSWGVTETAIRQCTPPGGFVSRDGDCNDADPTIYPAQIEQYYDGVDANCDGQSDFDADGDGFDSVGWAGLDCRDSDPTTFPGALERPGDGIDQDCDGVADEREPTVGELAITEVHPNPTQGPAYVEFVSRTGASLALDQLPLIAGSAHVLPDNTTMAPFAVWVVCDRASSGCDSVIPSLDLTDSDELRLGLPTLDAVPLDALPFAEGVAADWPLAADPADNDDPAQWCANSVGSLGEVPGDCDP